MPGTFFRHLQADSRLQFQGSSTLPVEKDAGVIEVIPLFQVFLWFRVVIVSYADFPSPVRVCRGEEESHVEVQSVIPEITQARWVGACYEIGGRIVQESVIAAAQLAAVGVQSVLYYGLWQLWKQKHLQGEVAEQA